MTDIRKKNNTWKSQCFFKVVVGLPFFLIFSKRSIVLFFRILLQALYFNHFAAWWESYVKNSFQQTVELGLSIQYVEWRGLEVLIPTNHYSLSYWENSWEPLMSFRWLHVQKPAIEKPCRMSTESPGTSTSATQQCCLSQAVLKHWQKGAWIQPCVPPVFLGNIGEFRGNLWKEIKVEETG